MGNLFDQAKDLAGSHPEQANQGLDAAENLAKEKTGGKYDSQIDKGRDMASEKLGIQQPAAPEGAQPPAPEGEQPQA